MRKLRGEDAVLRQEKSMTLDDALIGSPLLKLTTRMASLVALSKAPIVVLPALTVGVMIVIPAAALFFSTQLPS